MVQELRLICRADYLHTSGALIRARQFNGYRITHAGRAAQCFIQHPEHGELEVTGDVSAGLYIDWVRRKLAA